MIRVHKANQDFVFALDIRTYKDTQSRVSDFHKFVIKVYTTNVIDFIEASYEAVGTGNYINIIPQDDYDFLIINSNDLETLEDGNIKLHIEYEISANDWDDGQYNGCYDVETGFYLMDEKYNNTDCPQGCNLIDD